MEGGHRYVENLCLLTVVHSLRAKEWVFVDVWAWTYRHQWRSRDRCFYSHQPSLLCSALCRHHCRQAALAEALPSSGETFGMDPLAGRGNEKPPAGKGSPPSSGEAPRRGEGVDRGRKASRPHGSPFPCQPCSICWQEQCGAAAVCPPGSSPSCPPPQPRFPPCLHFICHKCRGRGEQSLPQTQEGEQPLFLESNPYFWIPAFPWVSLYFSLKYVVEVTN